MADGPQITQTPRARQRRNAWRMLLRRPRQPLMIAGAVAFSVCAVLIVMALMTRVRQTTDAKIRTMGANVITVTAQPSQRKGGQGRRDTVVKTMTLRDVRDISIAVPGVQTIAAELRGSALLKAGNLTRQAPVAGVETTYATLRDAPVARGRFFLDDEARTAQRVVVLGAEIARVLFPDADPLQQTLWIRRIPFTVVGVLPERGSGLDAFDEDDAVFVPLRTAQRRLFQVSHIHRIFVRIDERVTTLDQSIQNVTTLLAAHRKTNLERATPDFRVESQHRLVSLSLQSATRLQWVGISALVLLLLSGAGGTYAIQNVAMQERVTETGTRRALGASAGDIFHLFLFEAGITSVAGAVGGLLVAGIVMRGIQSTPAASVAAAVVCVCLAACIVAACFPAWKTARRQPAHVFRPS